FAQQSFDAFGLTAKKLNGYVKIPMELWTDAVEALGNYFIEGCAEGFCKAEDSALFYGDGSPTYGKCRGLSFLFSDGNHGASKFTATAGHNTFATLDANDLSNAIAMLPARALANTKIYCSVAAFAATFMRIGSAGGAITAHTGPDGRPAFYYG